MRIKATAALFCVLATGAQGGGFDPAGPFRPGEGMGPPATCSTLPHWVDRAPDYDGRISMTVTGTITQSDWDGALAYLVICPADGMQVLCVTYEPVTVGRKVTLAGGYMRAENGGVILDPCLSYPAK